MHCRFDIGIAVFSLFETKRNYETLENIQEVYVLQAMTVDNQPVAGKAG